MIALFFVLFLVKFIFVHCTLRSKIISVYCSDNLTYSDITYKICGWRDFEDTFDAALEDCPQGFELSNKFDSHIQNKISISACQKYF
jgi:hypothetical protein